MTPCHISAANLNQALHSLNVFIFTSWCNQWIQQAQVNNRSDEDYGNLSDVDSHKVADPVNTTRGFTGKVNGKLNKVIKKSNSR